MPSAITGWPGSRPVTPGPTDSMIPDHSCPGTSGYRV